MSKLLVRNFSISVDGLGAGTDQTHDNPLGAGGGLLHEWIFATRSGRQMIGEEGGSEGIDDSFFMIAPSAWAPPSWVATCSGQYVDRGARANGPAGGETILPFTIRYSCSLTTPGPL
jgi:hypothetical protein